MRQARFLLIGLTLLAAMAAVPTTPASASNIAVNTTDDELNMDGDCSLREAITAANTDAAVDACAAGDMILLPNGYCQFSIVTPGEDANTGGDLDLTGDVTISGSGADTTIVNGWRIEAVFHVLAGADDVTISGVTIAGALGGGVFNEGGATLNDTFVTNNFAGIRNASTGTLIINRSTISGNFENAGAAVNNGGSLTINNSTVSANDAAYFVGGIGNGGSLAVNNSTISNNTSGGMFGDSADGISTSAGSTTVLKNSIVANNGKGDCSGNIVSNGHNLDSDGSCGLTGPGDISNTDPLLAPLAGNGGPTQTHALIAGSPAIDAGSPDCPPPATDQRVVARPQGTACDMGAYEDDDTDGDGFLTSIETFVGTSAGVACGGSNAWPVDNNGDHQANLSDILRYIPVFGTTEGDGVYSRRYDLNADSNIGLSDILRFIPVFGVTCTP